MLFLKKNLLLSKFLVVKNYSYQIHFVIKRSKKLSKPLDRKREISKLNKLNFAVEPRFVPFFNLTNLDFSVWLCKALKTKIIVQTK